MVKITYGPWHRFSAVSRSGSLILPKVNDIIADLAKTDFTKSGVWGGSFLEVLIVRLRSA
jgi:hypothetical protein